MEWVLILVAGVAAGFGVGWVAGSMRATRRRRRRDQAVATELQAARQRAERAGGELQALRSRLEAADVLRVRVAELETELTALRRPDAPETRPTAGGRDVGAGPWLAAPPPRASTEPPVPGSTPATAPARMATTARPAAAATLPVAASTRPEVAARPATAPATAPIPMADAAPIAIAVGGTAAATTTEQTAFADPGDAVQLVAAPADRPPKTPAATVATNAPARASASAGTTPPGGQAGSGGPAIIDPVRSGPGPTALPAAPPRIGAPVPAPAPTRTPTTPAADAWRPLRPGLSDPRTWLGTAAPNGMAYREDDLQRVHGVGPYLARRLREEGVLTWRQVAEWDEDDMVLVARRIGSFPDRIRREDWPASARALHEAAYGERIAPAPGGQLREPGRPG